MVVFPWSLPTKKYLDACMSQQNYLNTEDGEEKLQILNTDVLLGALDILRLVY